MTQPELYVLDVDGCLIEGFLGSTYCARCRGTGRVPELPSCPDCKGKGQKFGGHLPYGVVKLLPRRREVLARLVAKRPGVKFALATNQGGVAMGYQTQREVICKMADVVTELDLFWSMAFSVHIAYYHPKARVDEWLAPEGYDLRKPQGGMIRAAMERHRPGPTTDLVSSRTALWAQHTVFIGDMATDRDAAEDAGVEFIWSQEFFGDPFIPGMEVPT